MIRGTILPSFIHFTFIHLYILHLYYFKLHLCVYFSGREDEVGILPPHTPCYLQAILQPIDHNLRNCMLINLLLQMILAKNQIIIVFFLHRILRSSQKSLSLTFLGQSVSSGDFSSKTNTWPKEKENSDECLKFEEMNL